MFSNSHSIIVGAPSAPENVSVSNITDTSLIIMWDTPLDDGGRSDTFYTITQNVTDIVYTTTGTSIMLTGLIPSVYYGLRITADNGVSSQDSNVEI